MPQLPISFIKSLQGLPGFDEAPFIAVHQKGEQVTSVRINPAKQATEDGQQPTDLKLSKSQILNLNSKIPWCSTGYYLPERPSFTLDPLFHAGAYYVQEASSMFLEQALRQTVDLSQTLKVLDLCAAPGGKSTHLQSLISADSLLVSNEVIKQRASILTENLTKWGAANVVVTNNDPAHFQRIPQFFNVLVVDAPCSGSGLFRRDAEAIEEWSEEAVQLCCQRQQRILADSLPTLQEGGIFIYSTCSYSAEEDEGIMQWLIKEMGLQNIRLQLQPDWDIVETETNHAFGYRFYPDKVKGEGFFLAAFQKPGLPSYGVHHLPKTKPTPNEKAAASILQPYFNTTMAFVAEKEDWLAMPETVAASLPLLKKHLYLRKAGVNAGRIIRNELVPNHELAVAATINNNIPSVDVNKEQALQYLRRQEVTDLNPPQNGWLLVRYEGLALGWVKAIGHRTNNYYPTEWRILK